MAPRIEPSPNRRAKCRVCYAQIDKAVLRVGTEAMSEWGPTTQWHHMSCLNLSKHVKSAAELAGFAELSGAHQAEVLGHFNGGGAASASAPPTPARPTPKKAAPKEARPEQIAEKAPLERGICAIEYAKAQKPSPCMICKGKIANGEPRVGDRQPSPYYEGVRAPRTLRARERARMQSARLARCTLPRALLSRRGPRSSPWRPRAADTSAQACRRAGSASRAR